MRAYDDKPMTRPHFLRLPVRTEWPRQRGVTHVLDAGMAPQRVDELLTSAGGLVDVWKLGWGTAYVDAAVSDKVAVCHRHGVLVCAGGTLLEVAWLQGSWEAFLDWAAITGFDSVEVSAGASGMPAKDKRLLIEQAVGRFTVLAEVGSKKPDAPVSPEAWADAAVEGLHAGARWVVAEGRESGQAGLYRPDRSVRAELVEALVARAGLDRLIFEAPHTSQQAWLLGRYGANVSLGNIPADAVLGLEALRLGLRADTVATLLGDDAGGA